MKKQLTMFVMCIFLNGLLSAETELHIRMNNNTSSLGNIGKRNYRTGLNCYDEVKLKSIYIQENDYVANRIINNSMRNILLGENDSLDQKNPSLLKKVGKESLYIGKQFLLGEICGYGCGYLCAAVGGEILGLFLGYAFGNALGVYWAGNNKQYQGPFASALGGSIMGAFLSFRIYSASQESHTSALAMAFGPIIGSIIHFNIFRKERVSNDEAFINYNQGTLKWSFGNTNNSYLYSKQMITTSVFQYNFEILSQKYRYEKQLLCNS
ncbi:hypothetical protein MUP95_02720 [bacterium]|nr:hypothetical protein [bacterium]